MVEQWSISDSLQRTFQKAFAEAKARRHELFTVEHLLAALLEEETARPVLVACGADLVGLARDLDAFLKQKVPAIGDERRQTDPLPSLAFQRVLQRAALRYAPLGSTGGIITGALCLVATFHEKDAHAVSLLDQAGVSPTDAARFAGVPSIQMTDEPKTVPTYVFEITMPGIWISHEDQSREWAARVTGLLYRLKLQFFDANTALNLFCQSRSLLEMKVDHDQFDRDFARRAEIRAQIEAGTASGSLDQSQEDEIDRETEIAFKREQWAQGHLPQELQVTIPFMHKRAFVYALNNFDNLLKQLEKELDVPAAVPELSRRMDRDFSGLTGARNIARELQDQAFDRVEIDVSQESMEKLRKILQEIFDAFRWHGPKQHLPKASLRGTAVA